MKLKVLKEETTVFNLQSLYLNDCFSSFFGKHAYVQDCCGQYSICRIWRKKDLHKEFCCLSKSVVLCNNRSSSFSEEYVCGIEIIPNVNIIKSITVNVVFNNCDERVKWSNKKETLLSSVKDILLLFIVCSNSIIDLSSLKEINDLGIYCIHVISVGIKEVGKVVPSTKIKLNALYSYETYKQFELDLPQDVFNQGKSIEELKDIIVNRKSPPNENQKGFLPQVLLIGPAGCGKKTLIKKVCHDIKAAILCVDLLNIIKQNANSFDELINQFKTASLLAEESPSGSCVILIKNIDTYCSKPGKVLFQLLKLIDDIRCKENLTVVATAENAQYIHQSLRTASRFSVELYLGIPNKKERQVILSHFLKDDINEECLSQIADCTPGFVLSDLLLFVKKASRLLKTEGTKNENELLKALTPCINEIMPARRKGLIGTVSENDLNLDDLGGLKDIKGQLKQAVVWPLSHPEAYTRFNIRQPSGVLLYGPPGCAKTSLARGIAALTKISFLSVSAADLFSPYVGDAEKTISQLFQRARASAPTILFIDELDALVGSRSFREKGNQERILSSFLTEMDGIGVKRDQEPGLVGNLNLFVFVIGATNRPQVIDSALLRPGRLDKLLFVPPPSFNDRVDILKSVTNKMPLSEDISLTDIAESTECYSGADLVNLCREAGFSALMSNGMDASKIKQKHFIDALMSMKPSLSAEQIRWYSEYSFSI